MLENTLITVAPTGAEHDKETWPILPTTLTEQVENASACQSSGAGMIHVHVRDTDHKASLDVGRLGETISRLRRETDLVIQISTGGAVSDTYDDRLRVLESGPDSCSLTMGTINFAQEIFLNPWPFIVDLYKRTQELCIVPEFEIFDYGHLSSLRRLLDEHGLPHGGKVHCCFVLGVPGGMPGTAAALADLVRAMPGQVTSWSATGIGRSTLPVMLAAIALGGNLRVGMEDTVNFAARQPVQSNAQLVTRAARLASLAQRPPMSGAQARQVLNIARRDQPARQPG